MMILELRPYNAAVDEPKTGWDDMAVQDALNAGRRLYVDHNGDIWTDGQRGT